MKEKIDEENKEQKWNFRIKVINIVLTTAGFLAIIIQLQQFYSQNETLQKQTDLLRKSLVQTYRPIGVVIYNPPDKKIDNYNYLKLDGRIDTKTFKGNVNIVFTPFLSNKGNGVLVYIGHVYYVSDTEYSFRQRLLEGLLNSKDVHFDWNYSRARQEPLLPNENSRRIPMRIDNIDLRDKYYFYALIFYEDQDINLYDTEHMLYFEPEKNVDENNKIVGGGVQKEVHHDVYNSYSSQDKDKLLLFIKERNHPMIEYFSQDSHPSVGVKKEN